MKSNISSTILICCFLFSVSLFAQKRKINNVNVQKPAKVSYRIYNKKAIIIPARKIMMRDNKMVWVFPTSTVKGHWATAKVGEKEKFSKKIKEDNSLHSLKFKEYKTYKEVSRYSAKIPNKAFEIDKFEEHPDWITFKGRKFNMKGVVGKTNIYYHNSIDLLLMSFAGYNKYDLPETNRANTDHILVTDTLFVGPSSLGFMNLQRRNRGYIKIIANCIIYERPIKVVSTMISNKTDFVFSAKKIFLKSPYKDLSNAELNNPSPPFIWKVDTNVEAYIDPFQKNEILLLNRLMINKLSLISSELQNPNTDYWAKDKLLAKFQDLRGRVKIGALTNDGEYLTLFNNLCNIFDTKFANQIIESDRSIGKLAILVEGDVKNINQKPFKYYALPTKASLSPVNNESTGHPDMLGDIYYQATGESKLTLTLETELGYDEELFKIAAEELKKKGMVLEITPPEAALLIDEQPLKVNGKTVGKIIPISDQILRLKIDLNDKGRSLLELFPSSNDIKFNVFLKAYNGQKYIKQELSLKVPNELLKEIDYEHLINKFNVIESNTLTDDIRITSQLSPNFNDDSGPLDYIEISLEFLFDNQKVIHRGPFRMSSFSVLASEKDISFIKHSENFKVKVTGTAYYEFDQRDIKDDTLFDSKFIVIEESLFKNE